MRKALIIVMILSLFLVSCGKITEGEIYDKEFIPEKSWVMIMPIVHTDGKHTYTTMVPIYYHHPDEYVIKIQSLDGENQATYYVTEAVYDACEIGMLFEYDAKRGDMMDEPIEKKREGQTKNDN